MNNMNSTQPALGPGGEPPLLAHWLPRGMAWMAAALVGLGVIFWVAANWDSLGRPGQFALLQGFVAVCLLGAWARPAARIPLGLAGLLGIGALLAYFGQTYQTGADPWTLFALWAALGLPLCLAARTDALWSPWAVVFSTAVSLWLHTHAGHRWWSPNEHDLPLHALAWAAQGALLLGLGPAAHRFTGAGVWARRTALTLAVIMVTFGAAGGLFQKPVSLLYLLGLLVLGVSAAALSRRTWFDLYGLSAVALALNGLLVAGLARWLFDGGARGDPIGELLILGLAAAALLAGSVSAILKRARSLGVQA